MSVIPTTSQPRNPSFHRTPPGSPALPRQARSLGKSYTPGMFDKLIDHPVLTPDHAPPEQVAGVHVELAASGRSVIVAEQLRGGACGPRHLLDLSEPHSVFMRLADGREVWVEIRAVEPAPEEDREPWAGEVAIEYSDYGAATRSDVIGGQLTAEDIMGPYPVPSPPDGKPCAFVCLEFLPR